MRSPFVLGKSRVEGLSDGVFSITMTLLVLKLEVPAVMHHSSNEDMLRQLVELWPAFAAYVVTFLIAGGFWFLHHLTFHFIRYADSALVWIDLLFLMLVSLLPFSAGLMSHLLVHPISQLFYFGNQIAIAVLLGVHWLYAKGRNLVDREDARRVRRLDVRIGLSVLMFAACLITALFLPAWSWVPLPVCLIAAAVDAYAR